MKDNEKAILWVILGIIFVIVILPKLPFAPRFAVVTQTICQEGVSSYIPFDEGNTLDYKGINDGVNHGGVFISGKKGQAIEFNGTTYIDFPSVTSNLIMLVKDYSQGDADYYFLAKIGSVNYVNGAVNNARTVIPLGLNFGLGLNGSVDEIIIFENLTESAMLSIYNNGSIQPICYQTTSYENVSCKDYSTSQVTDPGYGCLDYSGDIFPDCDYQWLSNQSSYYIENNVCKKSFYCSDGVYSTYQYCVENLTYNCYVLENNVCVRKIDYASCINSSYSSFDECSTHIVSSSSAPSGEIVSSSDSEETPNLSELTSKEIFNIFGFSITAVHLIILLIIVLGILYLTGAFGKK